MSVPVEFSADYVQNHSQQDAFTPYLPFLKGREPYASMVKNNPWLRPPDPRQPLDLSGEWYYNTTVGRKHAYWQDKNLPQPTKQLQQLRQDLFEWGFCLIEEGLSTQQLHTIKQRVQQQAEAEALLGLSDNSPALRIVWALVNKGECFVKCLELDGSGVQAGPVIEQLLNENLGKGWCHYSFLSNIALAGCYPQGLHQDQSALHPLQTPEAPQLLNVVYLLDDVNEHNGGTLMIPGSHKILSEVGSGGMVGELPPAINTEAKAGTIMLMDGRLLHGTGVNRSAEQRIILTNSAVKSWIRSQENWMLNVKPEVLAKASPQLLQRMGFQARVNENITEGFGSHGSGRAGDAKGAVKKFRQALDKGQLVRVGELSPEAVKAGGMPEFTVKQLRDALRG